MRRQKRQRQTGDEGGRQRHRPNGHLQIVVPRVAQGRINLAADASAAPARQLDCFLHPDDPRLRIPKGYRQPPGDGHRQRHQNDHHQPANQRPRPMKDQHPERQRKQHRGRRRGAFGEQRQSQRHAPEARPRPPAGCPQGPLRWAGGAGAIDEAENAQGAQGREGGRVDVVRRQPRLVIEQMDGRKKERGKQGGKAFLRGRFAGIPKQVAAQRVGGDRREHAQQQRRQAENPQRVVVQQRPQCRGYPDGQRRLLKTGRPIERRHEPVPVAVGFADGDEIEQLHHVARIAARQK